MQLPREGSSSLKNALPVQLKEKKQTNKQNQKKRERTLQTAIKFLKINTKSVLISCMIPDKLKSSSQRGKNVNIKD